MTSPDNPKNSGQPGSSEQTSVLQPGETSGEPAPSPAPRTAVEEATERTRSAPETGGVSKDTADSELDAATARVQTGSAATPDTGTAPPPWQRVPAELAKNGNAEPHAAPAASYGAQPAGPGLGDPTAHSPSMQPGTAGVGTAVGGAGAGVGAGGPFGAFGGQAAPQGNTPRPVTARRPGRGPRRASLQIKRVDPWSVLKLALVLSIALFFVWLVAVGVLYGVLSGMGVWDKLNGTYNELTQAGAASGDQLISAGRVFSIAAVIGAVNIVLFTALSTLAAFIYNVSSDLVGGIEVTLSERE